MNKNVKDATKEIISKYGLSTVLREIVIWMMLEADELDRFEPNIGDHSRRAANKVWNAMLAREGSRDDVVLKGTEVVN